MPNAKRHHHPGGKGSHRAAAVACARPGGFNRGCCRVPVSDETRHLRRLQSYRGVQSKLPAATTTAIATATIDRRRRRHHRAAHRRHRPAYRRQ